VKRIFVLLASVVLGAAWADEPAGYYSTASGLTGAPLRAALHNIIKGHTVINYTATRAPLESLDQDPTNSANLILLYERTSWPKSQFVTSFPGGWNREHCWPNSLGIDGAEPAYSDLFNLRACGEPANSDRANLYYDESTLAATGYEKPSGPTSPLCSQDFDSWEPPDEVKGDLARAMFYMDIRYEGGGSEPDLILTENTALISTSASYMGRLSTLLMWNFLDPVSPAERTRAEGVFGYQHNRNPFIDRAEWVEAIYGEVFKLTATFTTTAVTLSWPAILPADMAFIETSTDLIMWMPAAFTITNSGGRRNATIPLGSIQRFYRLKLQARAG
jgi:endonuclease I